MKSEQINEVMKAISKVQERLPVFRMDGYNPYFESHYVTLSNILEELMPIVREEGLAVIQPAVGYDNQAGVTTIVQHLESGQFIEYEILAPIDGKNSAQECGKAVTYLRRYALTSIFMLDSDEDIDGNASRQQKKAVGKKAPISKDISEAMGYWETLARQADEYGIEFEPLPPEPTEEEIKKAYLALQSKMEKEK